MVTSTVNSNRNPNITATGSNHNHNLFDNIPSIPSNECDPGLSTLQILRENDMNDNNHNKPSRIGCNGEETGTGTGNSYYDQVMNEHNNGTNMNMMNPLNCMMDFDEIPLAPMPIESEIEIRDEEHGRSIRLDQDILALNLIQPWAYCIVNRICKVFCYKTEFEYEKYPNGYWYAIRVHANRVCMSPHTKITFISIIFICFPLRINPTHTQ